MTNKKMSGRTTKASNLCLSAPEGNDDEKKQKRKCLKGQPRTTNKCCSATQLMHATVVECHCVTVVGSQCQGQRKIKNKKRLEGQPRTTKNENKNVWKDSQGQRNKKQKNVWKDNQGLDNQMFSNVSFMEMMTTTLTSTTSLSSLMSPPWKWGRNIQKTNVWRFGVLRTRGQPSRLD